MPVSRKWVAMLLDSKSSVIIGASPERLWEAFCDFERWPDWSSYFRSVTPEGEGWRFVFRSAQDINLSFVLVSTGFAEQEYIEFVTNTDLEHNANINGWVKFDDEEGHTRITLAVRGELVQSSNLLQGLSDWWSKTFVEPEKNLKVVLEDFKAKFEGGYDRVLEIEQPLAVKP